MSESPALKGSTPVPLSPPLAGEGGRGRGSLPPRRRWSTTCATPSCREMLIALGRAPDDPARRLLGPILRPPAARFARLMARTDRAVAQAGIVAGARSLASDLWLDVAVRGAEQIPTKGPLLVASNHPGAYDSPAVISNLPRNDLMIAASDIPFLRRLPAIGAHLIYVSPDTGARMAAIRAMIRHLRSDGAIFIYGTGLVDPDPGLMPGPREALESWSDSLALMLRAVPTTHLVVTIVSDVLAASCLRSPLTRLKADGWERRKLAEFLQISLQVLFAIRYNLRPRVSFAPPIPGSALNEGETQSVTRRIVARAAALLTNHMESRRESGIPQPSQTSS